MTAAGHTQAALARACGIKEGSVSGWFGKGKPTKMVSGDLLVKAATFLGTTAEYLMTGKGVVSQPERLDDATMGEAVDLLYLLADLRPDDLRFRRITWPMIKLAAEGIRRRQAGSEMKAVIAELLSKIE